ncbi:hypothetical protein FQ626_19345 (plasmid) [Erwinia pyrifoliae]|nr:hypothetical protein [Erwinia pyrifoliae]
MQPFPAVWQLLAFSFGHVSQRPVLKAQIREHLFQTAILIFQVLELLYLAGFHTALFGFPVVAAAL